MGVSLLQLSVTGIEDNYLNNNPNINFFKRFTYDILIFTMSTIEVLCSNLSLYETYLLQIKNYLLMKQVISE